MFDPNIRTIIFCTDVYISGVEPIHLFLWRSEEKHSVDNNSNQNMKSIMAIQHFNNKNSAHE